MADSGLTFKFRRNSRIGEAAAEMDDEFLFQSFFDVGDYEQLRDLRSPQRIVVGRTGAGKTALLRQVQRREEHVIDIDPEHLSLNFIANNDVIRFFENLGVKLDLFYSLLWKHVLTVELLRARFNLNTEERTNGWLNGLLQSLHKKNQPRERAFKYLQDWGDKFWVETEYRVKELTTKLEAELSSHAGLEAVALKAGGSAGLSLSEEQKKEIVHRAQKVVNDVQIKELAEVISYLNDEAFTDTQKPYYITIDRLDENWVEDSLRYKLIRALIETIKTFQRVQNVKIIVALRHDLLRKVFSSSSDSGFQEEKYEALLLKLRWNKAQIEQLLDKRVTALVRQQYTQRDVRLRELFPSKIGKLSFLDYFIQRTALRPRDAILFVNDCISRSESQGEVRVQTVYEAEKEYSKLRMKSLTHEWSRLYPSLPLSLSLLDHAPAEFRVSAIDKARLDDVILRLSAMNEAAHDPAVRAAKTFMGSDNGNRNVVASEIALSLYDVGAVGLRLEGGSGPIWSQESVTPGSSQIKPNTKLLVHPMLYQAACTVFH